MNYFLAFSTDYLEPYADLIKKYDELRDKATTDLIHERSEQESDKKNPTNVREMSWQGKMEQHYETIREACLSGAKINRTALAATTGLNDRDIVKMIAHYRNTEE
jgi:hypothetical protein